MFTGIVEGTGLLTKCQKEGGNLRLVLSCAFTAELKVDQSLSHNGVCLTVCRISAEEYEVVAIAETLQKTNLGKLQPGDLLNIERCMPASGRFDGHIVQGHVDGTGVCTSITEEDGSWRIWFSHDAGFSDLVVEKGSVCVNGVSLTVAETSASGFSVAIIPYTWEHTNFSFLKSGNTVNIEFDILGKYMKKMLGRLG